MLSHLQSNPVRLKSSASRKVSHTVDIGACRSHKDLIKEAAPHHKKARKFYDGLAAQLVQQGHALDVFACSLDQVPPGFATINTL